MPFIEEILNNIRAIICDLQPQQVHTFYEAVGYMIQAQGVSFQPLLPLPVSAFCMLAPTVLITLYLMCETHWIEDPLPTM